MATTCKLIAKSVLGASAATMSLGSIPATYTDLLLVGSLRMDEDTTFDLAKIRFNDAASDASHSAIGLYGNGTTAGSEPVSSCRLGAINGPTSTSNTFTPVEVYLPNYAGSTNKTYSAISTFETNATTAYLQAWNGLWSNTSAINRITILSGLYSGNFVSGSSLYLYGITKA